MRRCTRKRGVGAKGRGTSSRRMHGSGRHKVGTLSKQMVWRARRYRRRQQGADFGVLYHTAPAVPVLDVGDPPAGSRPRACSEVSRSRCRAGDIERALGENNRSSGPDEGSRLSTPECSESLDHAGDCPPAEGAPGYESYCGELGCSERVFAAVPIASRPWRRSTRRASAPSHRDAHARGSAVAIDVFAQNRPGVALIEPVNRNLKYEI